MKKIKVRESWYSVGDRVNYGGKKWKVKWIGENYAVLSRLTFFGMQEKVKGIRGEVK